MYRYGGRYSFLVCETVWSPRLTVCGHDFPLLSGALSAKVKILKTLSAVTFEMVLVYISSNSLLAIL